MLMASSAMPSAAWKSLSVANAQSTRTEVRVPRPLAGLGSPAAEAEADEHRLVLQDHPEPVGHAVSDGTGQGEDVGGGRATPVGHRKGVLGGQGRRPCPPSTPLRLSLIHI